jgi:hypothetical protein
MPEFHSEHSAMTDSDLDVPVWGAPAIARILNLLDARGQPDLRRCYYVLEQRYVDATKIGAIWCSTRRRLLRPHLTHITV